jgi:hypothetical protein
VDDEVTRLLLRLWELLGREQITVVVTSSGITIRVGS